MGGIMEEPVREKKQQTAIAHWENLKPRVEQARKDRDLDPIQKSDQEFWNIREKLLKNIGHPLLQECLFKNNQNHIKTSASKSSSFRRIRIVYRRCKTESFFGITAAGKRLAKVPNLALQCVLRNPMKKEFLPREWGIQMGIVYYTNPSTTGETGLKPKPLWKRNLSNSRRFRLGMSRMCKKGQRSNGTPRKVASQFTLQSSWPCVS